jgi:hypothetical protein
LLVYRVISPPDLEVILLSGGRRSTGLAETREVGTWIGLGACVVATAASLYAMRDERFPAAVREAGRVDVDRLPAPPPEGTQGGGS